MFILLKKDKLRQIIEDSIKKAGTYKNLSKKIKICRQKIWDYKKNNRALNLKRLNIILKYIGQKISKNDIEKELPDNWRQVIGGKNCVIEKNKDGTLNKQLAECRKHITERGDLKSWHREFKQNNPEEYYKTQYEHFKKVGSYKETTQKGEKVRNILEKDVANILKNLNLNYQYEPLINANGSYFFPDFLIEKKMILECTMWRGYDKATKLAKKIDKLNKNYQVYVIIPEKISKYYNTIKDSLIVGKEKLIELLKVKFQIS